ncbi:MAG TPA: hypothetical protein VFX28_17620, partial [Methylomirabilota bacterium]|nr:hypothetical protein [Methylomirabilota bacterium]
MASVEPSEFLDLDADRPALTLVAAGPDEVQAGGSPLAAGDFNGDGATDLLVGAPFADGPDDSRTDGGEAYVVFGPRKQGEVQLKGGLVDLVVYGALAGDNLGYSVAAGDLNDDGMDDIVVGAPASNGLTNIRTDLGEAYIIYGSRSLGGRVDLARREQDFTFRPAEGFTRVGTSFAVGDVNDDGVDDLVAGGPFGGRVEGTPAGSPRTTEGEVYVLFGGPGLRGDWDLAEQPVDVRLKGEGERDNFGQAVAVGDVNGDGVDDIIASASRADGPGEARQEGGEAFVFFGSKALSGLVRSAAADVTVYAAEARDGLGEMATAGDLNGDGLADIVLSARVAGGPHNLRPTAGDAYVIYGSPGLSGVIDLAEETPGAVVYGRDADDAMPSALAAADADGDGRDDLALGAGQGDGPENDRPNAGEVYVLFGAPQGEVDLRVHVEGKLFIFGADEEEQAGMAL